METFSPKKVIEKFWSANFFPSPQTRRQVCSLWHLVKRSQHKFSSFETHQLISWYRELKCSRSRETSSFSNLLYLSFNWVWVVAVNVFSSVNQMLRTLKLISLGNRLSSCWLRCKQFHLQFSLSVWTITLLYVASFQSQEIDEIKMSYSLNR